MRSSLLRRTASAKKVSASPEIAVAGYSLISSSVIGCAPAAVPNRASATPRTDLDIIDTQPFILNTRRGNSAIRGAQRAIEIVVEIVDIFEAGREAQQV